MPVSKDRLRERYRAELPYSLIVYPSGRQVLFNRHYQPILERCGGSLTIPGHPSDDWFAGRDGALITFFYRDRYPPWRDPKIARLCQQILAHFQQNQVPKS